MNFEQERDTIGIKKKSFRLWWRERIERSACGDREFRWAATVEVRGTMMMCGLNGGVKGGKKEMIMEYMVEVKSVGLGTDLMWEGGLNCVPQRYDHLHPPECDLIWNKGLCSCN